MSNKNSKLKLFVMFFLMLLCGISSSFGATVPDKCTSTGTRQYQPDGTCQTKSRICCGNGYFTDWNGSCSGGDNCKPGQCWANSKCNDRPYPEGPQSMTGGSYKWTCYCMTVISGSGGGWQCTKDVTCDSGWIKQGFLNNAKCMRYNWDALGGAGSGTSFGDCGNAPDCSSSYVNRTCTRRIPIPCVERPGLGYNCISDGNGNTLPSGYNTIMYTCRLVDY